MNTLNEFTWNYWCIFLIIISIYYIYMKFRVYTYWYRKGVEYFEPSFPLGNVGGALFMRNDIGSLVKDLHLQIKSRFAGLYMIMRPTLMIRDRDLIERILVKDFKYFMDRGLFCNEEKDPLSAHMYTLRGEKWEKMREKMCPAFEPERVKMMFGTIYDTGMALQGYVGQIADKNANNEIDIRDLSARYMTDIIASVAFGIDVDSIHDPTVYFRKMGARALELTFTSQLVLLLSYMAPNLLQIFHIKTVNEDVEEFMIETVRRTLQFRENNRISRDDFMQILIQMRNGYDIRKKVYNEQDHHNLSDKKMSIQECAAQVFIFFLAGFETSGSIISFCLYELAKNQKLLNELQDDIDKVMDEFNYKITYDCINKMAYLKRCVDETMRKYPSVPVLARICTKDYKIPDSNVVIEKGTNVIISTYGIHHDPAIYPNPKKFDPSRFTSDECAKRLPVDFLSIGYGPRECIAKELGLIAAQMALAALISKFNFKIAGNNNTEIVMDPKSYFLIPENQLRLNVTRRVFTN